VHQALGVNPTQSVLADVELPGVIAEHDRLDADRLQQRHQALDRDLAW
jgi:hypothetical protein